MPAPVEIDPTVDVIVANGIFIVNMNCCRLPLDDDGIAPSVFRFADVTESEIPAVENTV